VSTVLRIAITYFQMVPLQRWLNLGGLLLLALGAVLTYFADTVDDAKGVFMACLFGVMLIATVPALGGGIALRMASRPTIAHLRPHGRVKVLLGTTLAMTLIVLLLCVPTLAANGVMMLRGLAPSNRFGEASAVLLLVWPLGAMSWIILFATSRTMLGALAFPLVVMGAMKLAFLLHSHPKLTIILLVTLGPAAWLAFSLWYLRAGRIQQPQSPFSTPGNEHAPFQWLFGGERSQNPATTPAVATFHYLLGVSSYWIFLISGVWIAVLFLLMQVILPRAPDAREGLLMMMLPFLTFNSAVMGYTTARRARLLWLRTGVDRAGLYRVAERLGLCASMITWGLVGGAVLAYALAMNPDNARNILLFVASQGAAAVCMFYGGFALVKDWSLLDKAITLILLVLFLLQITVLGPRQMGSHVQSWTLLLLIASVLALALRWYGQHQWRLVDWRLIRPARLDGRRST
jgi:hypothetical protein